MDVDPMQLAAALELDPAVQTSVVVYVGVVGLFIGSFLNVVIYRVPAGLSVVRPRSRCPYCGHEITAAENIPVLSWILLRGRCKGCHEPISVRYPLVELLTGLLFAAMTVRFGVDWQLPAYLYLVAVGVALAFIDLDTMRLPDRLTLPSYPVAAVLLALPALLDHRWGDYWHALAGGVALFALYFVLWFVRPAAMGFGDVKLAGVLGMYLGWLGWGVLLVGAFLGFLVGAVVGIVIIVVQRSGARTRIPYGPYMVAGTLIAVFAGQSIADWYTGLAFG